MKTPDPNDSTNVRVLSSTDDEPLREWEIAVVAFTGRWTAKIAAMNIDTAERFVEEVVDLLDTLLGGIER